MSIYFYDEALIKKLKSWTENTLINVYGPNETLRLFEVMADVSNDKPIQLPIICLRRNGGYYIDNPNKKTMTYDGISIDSTAGPFLTISKKSNTISELTVNSIKFFKLIPMYKTKEYIFKYKNSNWILNNVIIDIARYGINYIGTPINGDYINIKIDNDTSGKTLMLNCIPITILYLIDVYTRYLKEADLYTRDLIFNIINHSTLDVTIPYNNSNILHNANIRLMNNILDNSDIPELAFKKGQFSRMSLFIDIDDAYLWDAKIRNNIELTEDIIDIY